MATTAWGAATGGDAELSRTLSPARLSDWRYVHYQSGDFAAADVPYGGDFGELYHLEDDPHETRNLYGDLAFRDAVVEGERKRAEWLVATQHVRNTFSGGPYSDNYL